MLWVLDVFDAWKVLMQRRCWLWRIKNDQALCNLEKLQNGDLFWRGCSTWKWLFYMIFIHIFVLGIATDSIKHINSYFWIMNAVRIGIPLSILYRHVPDHQCIKASKLWVLIYLGCIILVVQEDNNIFIACIHIPLIPYVSNYKLLIKFTFEVCHLSLWVWHSAFWICMHIGKCHILP